jgi:hypothetical protein
MGIEVFYGLGALLLLGGLAYAMWRSPRLRRSDKPVSTAATKALYHQKDE